MIIFLRLLLFCQYYFYPIDIFHFCVFNIAKIMKVFHSLFNYTYYY